VAASGSGSAVSVSNSNGEESQGCLDPSQSTLLSNRNDLQKLVITVDPRVPATPPATVRVRRSIKEDDDDDSGHRSHRHRRRHKHRRHHRHGSRVGSDGEGVSDARAEQEPEDEQVEQSQSDNSDSVDGDDDDEEDDDEDSDDDGSAQFPTGSTDPSQQSQGPSVNSGPAGSMISASLGSEIPASSSFVRPVPHVTSGMSGPPAAVNLPPA